MEAIPMITRVTLFVAASPDELREDCAALSDYVRKLNDIYMERGVFFRLCFGEDELNSPQDRKDALNSSQLFFVILFNRAGESTLQEFEAAYARFREAGTPAIVTCFRQGEGYAPQQGVLAFMKQLDQELGHYYKVYEHIDSLKLCLLMQLKLMNLDVPVEFRDGKALVSGRDVLHLEGLPFLANNADFQRLRAERDASEAEFQAAKARHLQNPADDSFIAADERRMRARRALESLEENLLALLLNAEDKGAKGQLSPRQREACALLERGDSRAASAMLDLDEILADAAHEERVVRFGQIGISQLMDELLQKIEIEKTLVDDPARFERIEHIYECAIELERKNLLKKRALGAYCAYLRDQNAYQRALHWAKIYKQYMELDGDESDLADACMQLGLIYVKIEHPDSSDEIEKELPPIEAYLEKLEGEDRPESLPERARLCLTLGELHSKTARIEEAEEEYKRAREIFEKLAEEDPLTYLPGCADACTGLGMLYRICSVFDPPLPGFPQGDAWPEHLRAKKIYQELISQGNDALLPKLAQICIELGEAYCIAHQNQSATAEYQQAMDICEKLAEENPAAFLPLLARAAYALGEQRRSEVFDELIPEDTPDAIFIPNLQLDEHPDEAGKLREGERELRRAEEIYEKLERENAGLFQEELAELHVLLSTVYLKTQRMDEAEAELKRAKYFYEQLVDRDPTDDYTSNKAATICSQLSQLYKRANQPYMAALERRETVRFRAKSKVAKGRRKLESILSRLDLLRTRLFNRIYRLRHRW